MFNKTFANTVDINLSALLARVFSFTKLIKGCEALILNIVLAVVGFAVLIKCADFFVDGASSLAKNLKIPTVVIGLTIVAFGTSAPELAISFSSHLSGNTDMMFGNVMGSNVSNILLILGLAVLIKPFSVGKDVIKKEIPILLLITAGVSVLFLNGNALSRSDGIIMLLLFSIFVYYLVSILTNKKSESDNTVAKAKFKIPMSCVMIAAGLAGIIIGSNLVVNNAAQFAESIGVSQKIISVTIISIGTSLPELVTTIVATKKGENSLAIGNIIGSNIFNTAIVLGLPVVFFGEVATTAFGIVDIVFMLLAVVLLWIFAATGRKLRRCEGAVLLAVYGGYIAYIVL